MVIVEHKYFFTWQTGTIQLACKSLVSGTKVTKGMVYEMPRLNLYTTTTSAATTAISTIKTNQVLKVLRFFND